MRSLQPAFVQTFPKIIRPPKSDRLLEEGVGVLRAFEGRAEIDEVHGRVGDVALEDAEIVAVVEGAHVRVGVADGRALGEGL